MTEELETMMSPRSKRRLAQVFAGASFLIAISALWFAGTAWFTNGEGGAAVVYLASAVLLVWSGVHQLRVTSKV
jgi:hypothetical protein